MSTALIAAATSRICGRYASFSTKRRLNLVLRQRTYQYALSRSPAKTHTHRYGRGHSGGPRHLVLGQPGASPVVVGQSSCASRPPLWPLERRSQLWVLWGTPLRRALQQSATPQVRHRRHSPRAWDSSRWLAIRSMQSCWLTPTPCLLAPDRSNRHRGSMSRQPPAAKR